MRVRLVSLENCGATAKTIEAINEVALEMGVDLDFEHIVIATQEEARLYRHIGSPTVQVEGHDIEPQARVLQRFGLS